MTTTSRGAWALAVSLSVPALVAGCGGSEGGQGSAPEGAAAAHAGPNPGGPAAGSKSSPEIKRIMVKLGKGKDALTPVLGNELKAEEPAWETIQGQTKEYAQLAGDLAKYDPPKGAKESWTKLTGEFSAAVSDLDDAARAKDKVAATAAHGTIANSCMACHRQHRPMGPGMGGPGGGMKGRPGPRPNGPPTGGNLPK